jgi:hypothetical protein
MARKNLPEQSREKRLGRRADTGARKCAALLQSPREGLHGGKLRNAFKQVV